jgi:acyl-coenzyme A synthetase/AMP-(fatty) acid ligase
VDTFILMFALARIGASCLVMDKYSKPQEVSDFVDALSLDVMIVEDILTTPLSARVYRLDSAWRTAVERCDPDAVNPAKSSSGFMINTSSGTTGRPKGLILSHAQYCQRWQCTQAAIGWGQGERHLCLGRLGFSGARNSCLFHLLSGNSVVLGPHWYSLDELVDWVGRYRVSSLFAAPSMLCRLLAEITNPTDWLIPEVKYLWVTGGSTAERDKVMMRRALCSGIYDEYGASGFGTISCLTPDDQADQFASVGRPATGVEVEIVDEVLGILPEGEVGRIRCKGPAMSTGFENDGNAQSYEFFLDGWFYPGDMGYLDIDGYLYIQGRATDMILRGDINIYPEEIELVLNQHPAVKEVAVVGITDSISSEQVLAYVCLLKPCTAADLINFCRQHLSSHKIPDAIRFTEALPRTGSGKIRRNALVDK